MIEADAYLNWVLVGWRIRLGWAFGYLFRIDVVLFFAGGLLCKIQTNLFFKIIRFYKIFFFFFSG